MAEYFKNLFNPAETEKDITVRVLMGYGLKDKIMITIKNTAPLAELKAKFNEQTGMPIEAIAIHDRPELTDGDRLKDIGIQDGSVIVLKLDMKIVQLEAERLASRRMAKKKGGTRNQFRKRQRLQQRRSKARRSRR
jgi:hypothetical protein